MRLREAPEEREGREIPGVPLAAVAVLSAAALAYEILLLRYLAVRHWQPVAASVISLALLGYGASGTFIHLAGRFLLRDPRASFRAASLLFGLSSAGCLAAARRLPLNPLELAWDPNQWLLLGASHLVLAVPFLAAASAVGVAYAARATSAGRVYAADLLGAGTGTAAAVAALLLVDLPLCLRTVSFLAFVAAGLAGWREEGSKRRRRVAPLLLAAAGLALAAGWPEGWVGPVVSEYKGESRALLLPGAAVIAGRSGPLGLLSVVRSPMVPFRYAPGLSLNAPLGPPEQLALFTDGDGMSPITRRPSDPAALDYLKRTTAAAAYILAPGAPVLVLGAGGGSDVLQALAHGAPLVDAVEQNADVVDLVGREFRDFSGDLYGDSRVRVWTAEARSFVARSRRRWGLIVMSLLDQPGTSGAGLQGLAEGRLYTVEAFEDLLGKLAPGGILAVTRWVSPPPRDILRLVATASRALGRGGVDDPGTRLAVVRGPTTVTLLVGNGPLRAGDIRVLREFCRENWFDLDWYPGMAEGEADRYGRLPAPTIHEGVRRLLGPGREAFLRGYTFDIAPVTDDRPYFSHFFRWRALPELLRLRGRGGAFLLEWGYLALAAAFLQATLAGLAVIVLPLRLASRRAPAPGSLRGGLLFVLLGLGFMLMEVAFIHRLNLFLGDPVWSAAAVIGTFLLFAGLGGGMSRRGGRGAGRPAAVAALISLLYLAGLPAVLRLLSPLAEGWRTAAGVVLMAPLAFVMGMPFPRGLTALAARRPDWVPWAWGLNGWASVTGALLASLVGIHLGSAALVGAAALLYLGAAWCAGGPLTAPRPPPRRSAPPPRG